MRFEIRFVPSADEDLDHYDARQQRIILDAIGRLLQSEADVESKRRKQLRPGAPAPWELRVGNHRVFYEIRPGGLVRVVAVGHEVHNELFIRGRKVEL
jgi:mRNA-degrading endonuclease RelE of RelBE toxin-antitoxin system